MKGKSIASMACGIASCVCFSSGFVGLACAIVALVLSSGCIKEGYENQFTKVGKITGIIGLILSIIGTVVVIGLAVCGTALSIAGSN